jgi:hypothetical protein
MYHLQFLLFNQIIKLSHQVKFAFPAYVSRARYSDDLFQLQKKIKKSFWLLPICFILGREP